MVVQGMFRNKDPLSILVHNLLTIEIKIDLLAILQKSLDCAIFLRFDRVA